MGQTEKIGWGRLCSEGASKMDINLRHPNPWHIKIREVGWGVRKVSGWKGDRGEIGALRNYSVSIKSACVLLKISTIFQSGTSCERTKRPERRFPIHPSFFFATYLQPQPPNGHPWVLWDFLFLALGQSFVPGRSVHSNAHNICRKKKFYFL